MHGSSDRARLWIRVFAAPILLAAATGTVGQYVAWVTVGAPVLVVSWVWVRCRTKKNVRFSRATRGN